MYVKLFKRLIDVTLSMIGLCLCSWVYLFIAIAIIVDDPGPILFTQKRVGLHKEFFKLHKFRSMKMSTPHDTPTHLLENPEQYITRVGRFLRKSSLDELPQIWDIFIGKMSIVGPRPALWNQDDLVAERDKYGANDVRPGLTGWAQINGRDELEIPVKAKLDGEYCDAIRKSGWDGFKMDCKCFFGTFKSVVASEGVVEGGTGALKDSKKRDYISGRKEKEIIGNIGFGESVEVDGIAKKRILITGTNSYIGNSFTRYAQSNFGENFEIDEVDMREDSWRDRSFSKYDVVYHVAGIAHADVGKVSEAVKEKYYEVNTDLAIEVAEKAKRDGVKQFVFMSSMIVYGESAPYGKKKIIDENTIPFAMNFYGDSKLQADVAIRALADDAYKVIVLRPPMIYGKESKGNYPLLAKFAKKLPFFPDVINERSMLYIDNLCELLCQIMLVKDLKQNATVLLPQNDEWTNTSQMVKGIAYACQKKMLLVKAMAPLLFVASKMPGKIGILVNKAFGNCCYSKELSKYQGIEYQKIPLQESIIRTERK